MIITRVQDFEMVEECLANLHWFAKHYQAIQDADVPEQQAMWAHMIKLIRSTTAEFHARFGG